MSRLARLVVPGLPHHVTQRGNGGQKVFFTDADYELYMGLLADSCAVARVTCVAFTLLPDHIHLILVPATADGLRAALAPTHRAYAGALNGRRKRSGHFWQGRYGAAVMDDDHLAATFRHMLLKPVEAGLARKPEKWPWSSAGAYLKREHDGLTDPRWLRDRFSNPAALLAEDADIAIRDDETIGRPQGSKAFIARLERKTGRSLNPAKRGPKPKQGKKKAIRALAPK